MRARGAETRASARWCSTSTSRRRCATCVGRPESSRAEDAAEDAKCDVVVFVNAKSGGRRGKEVFRRLRRALKPPHRVLDATKLGAAIDRGDPEATRWDPRTTRALVAGGDGTVGFVADALRRVRTPPPIAVAPLGTGNDLARVLGWNDDVWDDERLFDERRLVSTLHRATVGRVDRWSLDARRRGRTGKTTTTRRRLFTNYLGIGVDARAALAFDTARKDARFSWLFAHATTNKLLYAVFGARDFLQHSFARLVDDVVVVVDDRVVEFPSDTEGIILLNINSFSGGVRMWSSDNRGASGDATFTKSRADDGVLEIVAVTGALHLGQLNARVAKPVQVAQGRRVRVELKRDLPVQIDGEPWLQRAGTLDVALFDSLAVLRRPRRDRLKDLLDKWFQFASMDDAGEETKEKKAFSFSVRRAALVACFFVVAAFAVWRTWFA